MRAHERAGRARAQVQRIRLLLRERGLGAVRVGTVDDYQGQEERVIVISTARAAPAAPAAWPAHGACRALACARLQSPAAGAAPTEAC